MSGFYQQSVQMDWALYLTADERPVLWTMYEHISNHARGEIYQPPRPWKSLEEANPVHSDRRS
jgi:hypothetical protein